MTTEQAKSPAEQPAQPTQVVAYPPAYGPPHYAPMPPGAYAPPFYTFAPIPDPNHDPNAPGNGPPQPPYLMAFPPPPHGVVYAYAPPHGQRKSLHVDAEYLSVAYSSSAMMYPPYPTQQMVAPPRPKRKQVKMAVSVQPLFQDSASATNGPPVHQLRCSLQALRRHPSLRALPEIRNH